MSSPSELWRDWKLPGSSRSLRQACFNTRKNAVLSLSVQQRFFAHTKALVTAFREAGNSFDEDSHEVVIIDTKMHVRERNIDRLFEVGNADCPPSLSQHDVLRRDQKSDLLSCLEVECPSDFDETDAKLIDGAHMVDF